MTALTTQLAALIYLFIFASAIRLRYTQPERERSFKVPGGNVGMWMIAGVGFITSLAVFFLGFVPPEQLDTETDGRNADVGFENLCEDVRNTLQKMDVEKRELMRQRFEMGLSLQEIADSKQLNLSATKMRFYRALDEFKAVYEREHLRIA